VTTAGIKIKHNMAMGIPCPSFPGSIEFAVLHDSMSKDLLSSLPQEKEV
jgi:hypothetical protein